MMAQEIPKAEKWDLAYTYPMCKSVRVINLDGISIFSAELVALLWALWWVEEGCLGKCFFCADSLSALTS